MNIPEPRWKHFVIAYLIALPLGGIQALANPGLALLGAVMFPVGLVVVFTGAGTTWMLENPLVIAICYLLYVIVAVLGVLSRKRASLLIFLLMLLLNIGGCQMVWCTMTNI